MIVSGEKPGRHKTDFPGPKFFQPQEFQTEHLMVELHGTLNILSIDHHMV